jgi:hypothetical protein
MASPLQVRVVLDLDTDCEPICGSLTEDERPSRRFYGWLELAGLLQAVRTDSAGFEISGGSHRPSI